MIDAATAAASAVAFVTPALIEIAKGGAARIGESAIDPVLGWLRRTLTGRAHEALTELEQAPHDADNQAVLRKQLAKALQHDTALLAELRALLQATPPGDSFSQTLGAGAKGVQIKGSGNSVIQ